MATAQSTCVSGHAIVGDVSVTAQELEDAIENKTDGDFDRSHVKSGSTIPGIGTSAPTSPPALQTAEAWIDPTDPLDTGTTKTHILNSYNGSEFRPGVVCWFIGASAPTHTAGRGMAWWDSALKIKRLYSTTNGLTGWHPVDRGLALMTNNNASTCPSGGVVVSDNQAGSPTAAFGGAFTMTTTKKDMSVTGVALESIAAAATGVIALVGSGIEVEILCDNASADATVAAGDMLVTFSVIGEARGVGPQIADPNISTTSTQAGTPMGAFAVALEAKDGTTHLARSRLLGFVGQGAWRHIDPVLIANAADYGASGSEVEIDMLSHPRTGSILVDDNHKPILAVELHVQMASTAGGSKVDCDIELGPTRTNRQKFTMRGQAGSSSGGIGSSFNTVIPTKSNNADTFSSAGNFIQTTITETAETFTTLDTYAKAYLY